MLQSCGIDRHSDVEEQQLRVLPNYGWECWDMQRAPVLSVISKYSSRCNKGDIQHAELTDLRSDAFVSDSFN